MLSITNLKTGVTFILDGQPYVVLEYNHQHLGRGGSTVQVRLKNLINGAVLNRSFKPSDQFEEAQIDSLKANFLYAHRDQFWFAEKDNPKNRLFLTEKTLENKSKYLKADLAVDILFFQNKAIGIKLPIKVDLKVIEAPPGIKGDTAQGGNKTVIVETGLEISAPLFIKEGDIIRINTETDTYAERVEKNSD